MTINDKFYDALLRHQTYLLRHSSYIRNRINSLLNDTEAQIAALIIGTAGIQGLRTEIQFRKYEKLLEQIKTIRSGAWDMGYEELKNFMTEIASTEPKILRDALKETLPVQVSPKMPAPRLLRAIALSRPFEGRVLRDWAKSMQEDDLRRIRTQIQLGMIAGEDNKTIARRVIGTQRTRGANGVTQMTRAQVQAVTRTAVQHVANAARNEFFNENSDIITGERYVATLDARTTVQCASLDGQVFEVGEGPKPPLHFNCRSLRVAVFDGDVLGKRPAKPGTEKELLKEFSEKNNLDVVTKRANLPYGQKGKFDQFARQRIREMTGRVPASTTYNEWLKRQSVAFQNDTLGVTKARLFRDGGLQLDRFVDRNGSELTLAQLAKRNADAFKRAGLNPEDFN